MRRLAPALLLALLPFAAGACEPILPLARLLVGPYGWAPSLAVLAGAVALKCGVFATLDRSMPWPRAFFLMLVANFMTTALGGVATVCYMMPSAFLVGLPLVYLVSMVPARRLASLRWPTGGRRLGDKLAILAPLGVVVTGVLFGFAQSALSERSLIAYWLLKVGYILVGLGISIALTTAWEEWMVWRLMGPGPTDSRHLVPVLRANLVTFVAVMLAAAICMLPKRLASADFLAAVDGARRVLGDLLGLVGA